MVYPNGFDIIPIFDLIWAIVKSNSVPWTIVDDVLPMVFRQLTSSCPWSDQYFCLVHISDYPILLEYLNKIVVEPIDNILIASMFEEDHYDHLAIMLETFENHLCVITK